VLPCVAVCCRVLPCVAVCVMPIYTHTHTHTHTHTGAAINIRCSVLQCVAVCCSVCVMHIHTRTQRQHSIVTTIWQIDPTQLVLESVVSFAKEPYKSDLYSAK